MLRVLQVLPLRIDGAVRDGTGPTFRTHGHLFRHDGQNDGGTNVAREFNASGNLKERLSAQRGCAREFLVTQVTPNEDGSTAARATHVQRVTSSTCCTRETPVTKSGAAWVRQRAQEGYR